MVSDSILNLTKKKLGLTEEDDSFDEDIISAINSVFSILYQLGVGPDPAYAISGAENTWDEFTTDPNLNFVKDYIWMKTKLLFDEPQSSSATESLNKKIAEFEWRLNVAVDPAR